MKIRVLFLCASNSIQSPIAEALLKRQDPQHFEVTSAGIECGEPHSLTIEVMKEIGVDLHGEVPRTVRDLDRSDFDFVITMCELARSACPAFRNAEAVHWQFDDLEGSVDPVRQKRWFRSVRDQIAQRVRLFALVQVRSRTIEVMTSSSKTSQANLIQH